MDEEEVCTDRSRKVRRTRPGH